MFHDADPTPRSAVSPVTTVERARPRSNPATRDESIDHPAPLREQDETRAPSELALATPRCRTAKVAAERSNERSNERLHDTLADATSDTGAAWLPHVGGRRRQRRTNGPFGRSSVTVDSLIGASSPTELA
jgi:hypothetical protein